MDKILFSKLPKETKEKYNKKMVSVLSHFAEFCEEHNLRYSLAYGSVLGAVRHKGIIPWDYDIDTYMPRPDYEKFIKLFKEERSYDYQLLTPYDPFYPEPFAKIGDKHTSLLFTTTYPVDYGIFIDIFPLDGAADNNVKRGDDFDKFNSLIKLFRLAQKTRSRKALANILKNGWYLHALLLLFSTPFKNLIKSHCIRRMKRLANSHPYDSSDYVIQYRDDSYGREKAWFPREWIENTIKVSFEGIMVRIPKDYDKYLKHYYGNYMQLPPENKRDDRHAIDFLNIDEREPMKDILAKLYT